MIICLLYTFLYIIQILYIVLVFNPEKNAERLPLRYVSGRHVIMFSVAGSTFEIYFT